MYFLSLGQKYIYSVIRRYQVSHCWGWWEGKLKTFYTCASEKQKLAFSTISSKKPPMVCNPNSKHRQTIIFYVIFFQYCFQSHNYVTIVCSVHVGRAGSWQGLDPQEENGREPSVEGGEWGSPTSWLAESWLPTGASLRQLGQASEATIGKQFVPLRPCIACKSY